MSSQTKTFFSDNEYIKNIYTNNINKYIFCYFCNYNITVDFLTFNKKLICNDCFNYIKLEKCKLCNLYNMYCENYINKHCSKKTLDDEIKENNGTIIQGFFNEHYFCKKCLHNNLATPDGINQINSLYINFINKIVD